MRGDAGSSGDRDGRRQLVRGGRPVSRPRRRRAPGRRRLHPDRRGHRRPAPPGRRHPAPAHRPVAVPRHPRTRERSRQRCGPRSVRARPCWTSWPTSCAPSSPRPRRSPSPRSVSTPVIRPSWIGGQRLSSMSKGFPEFADVGAGERTGDGEPQLPRRGATAGAGPTSATTGPSYWRCRRRRTPTATRWNVARRCRECCWNAPLRAGDVPGHPITEIPSARGVVASMLPPPGAAGADPGGPHPGTGGGPADDPAPRHRRHPAVIVIGAL